jgi:hypothetical protein
MELYYTSYTKTINNTTYYFVKKFTRFPELENVPAILEGYGMHTNFNKACSIADVQNPAIRQRLFKEAAPGLIYSQNIATNTSRQALSKTLRVQHVNNKTSLVSRLTIIKKNIASKIPHWHLLPHG